MTLLDDFEVSELRALAKALVNHIASLSTHYSPLPLAHRLSRKEPG
ncbi:hypothetical protein [Agrococcus sp. KRD186]|nr:hypothetical protein [Agrococcus sp. KRD186]